MNDRHFQAEIGLQGLWTFSVDKPSMKKRGRGSVLYAKEFIRPILCRAISTTIYDIIQVDIVSSEGITLYIVLVYPYLRITVGEDEVLFDKRNNINSSSHESFLMGDFNLPDLNWTTLKSELWFGRFM